MAKAKAVGSFLGGLLNNPSALIGIIALGGLLIFRDKISDYFQSLTEGFGKVDITLPEIKFPELPTLELPTLELPTLELPTLDTSNILDQITNFFSGLGATEPPAADDVPLFEEGGGIDTRPIGATDIRTSAEFGTTIRVPEGDEFNLGGGPSFIGGTTTFGSNLVDTLSEVLNIFPNLTASQARDTLEEFQGLTASQFRLIDPDVINITGEEQIYNVSSGGFTGLTPEQIAKLLTGGDISNF